MPTACYVCARSDARGVVRRATARERQRAHHRWLPIVKTAFGHLNFGSSDEVGAIGTASSSVDVRVRGRCGGAGLLAVGGYGGAGVAGGAVPPLVPARVGSPGA